MSILIKNANIVKTGKQGSGTFQSDILIEGNTIKEIGINITDNTERAIDATGKFIIPGFIQSHVHLCQTLFRGKAENLELLDWLETKIWPFEASHTSESIYESAMIGLQELISSGTTTIVDMATSNFTEKVFEAAKDSGIRAFIGNSMMDCGEKLPPKLSEKIDVIISKSLKLIENFHQKENGRLNYILSPRFILSCSDDLFRQARSLQQSNNLLIQTHACENINETKQVKEIKSKNEIKYFEQCGIFNEKLILAHCVWLENDDIELLSKYKANVAHCPTANLKLGSGIAKITEMLKAGVNVCLGSDGAPCNNSLNMFNEMKLTGLLQKYKHGAKSLPAKEILDMSTINGAKALGMENELGSIEENKKADLLILDLEKPNTLPVDQDIYSRIVYCADKTNIDLVMIDGCEISL